MTGQKVLAITTHEQLKTGRDGDTVKSETCSRAEDQNSYVKGKR